MMKKCLKSFLMAVLLLSFSGAITPSYAWLIFHKPEFRGKVIDAETKKPIEGAVVVAIYSKKAIRWAPESVSITIRVKEALTDKNGYFRIPSYTTLIDPLAWSKEVYFVIYKPGYGSFPDWRINPPKGMDIEITWDEFFSGQVGEIREVTVTEPWKKDAETWKEKVAFGVVELPRLETKEERLRAMPSIPGEMDSPKKLPLFYKAINEENRRFGFDEIK